MSIQWVESLNSSNSRLHKESVLSQALTLANLGDISADRFLKLLKICYDPMITFGVKKYPLTEGISEQPNNWLEFDKLLDKLVRRELTGHSARDAIIEVSQLFDSSEWNGFCVPVMKRDIRCGITATTVNKIVKGTQYVIPIFSCQLATNGEGRPEMAGKVRLEGKLDGTRCLAVFFPIPNVGTYVTLYSRNGQVFENFTEIERQLFQMINEIEASIPEARYGFVLDGEIMGQSFQTLMTQLRRKSNVQANDSVYNIFDFIPLHDFNRGYWNANQEKRNGILESIRPFMCGLNNISLVSHLDVDLDTSAGWDQYRRYSRDCLDAGLEGVMIKRLDAPYQCKRTTHWMKYKPVHSYDLQVYGLEEGEGKYAGMLGALLCGGVDDGKQIAVRVGTGISDEQRVEFYTPEMVDKTVEVFADGITKNKDGTYSLRFPRFNKIRHDK